MEKQLEGDWNGGVNLAVNGSKLWVCARAEPSSLIRTERGVWGAYKGVEADANYNLEYINVDE